MTHIKNGDSPATPCKAEIVGNDGYPRILACPGLTKREYFAGLAMQGLCANSDLDTESNAMGTEDIALWAVMHADALLAELEDNKP